MPLSTIIFGDITGELAIDLNQLNVFEIPNLLREVETRLIHNCFKLSVLGGISLLCGYIQISLVTSAGHNIVHKLKLTTFKALLRLVELDMKTSMIRK